VKQTIKVCIYAFILLVVLSGCTIYKDLKVNNSEISGPVAQLPVNIVRHKDTSVIDLSVGVGYNLNKQKVIENNYNIENSVWNINQLMIDAYLDIKFKNGIAFFAGFDYSQSETRILSGGIIGLGRFDTISSYATRIDAGVKINSMHHNANFTYFKESTFGGGGWINDSTLKDFTSFDLFLSFTLNTTRKDWLINPFIRMAYIHQNILSIRVGPLLGSDAVSLNVNNVILSTGISIEAFKNMYIITGLHYNLVYLPNYVKPFSNFMPFVRVGYEFETSKIVK
jgi:hypothetical protein